MFSRVNRISECFIIIKNEFVSKNMVWEADLIKSMCVNNKSEQQTPHLRSQDAICGVNLSVSAFETTPHTLTLRPVQDAFIWSSAVQTGPDRSRTVQTGAPG